MLAKRALLVKHRRSRVARNRIDGGDGERTIAEPVFFQKHGKKHRTFLAGPCGGSVKHR
jgi:hypothetical protein